MIRDEECVYVATCVCALTKTKRSYIDRSIMCRSHTHNYKHTHVRTRTPSLAPRLLANFSEPNTGVCGLELESLRVAQVHKNQDETALPDIASPLVSRYVSRVAP